VRLKLKIETKRRKGKYVSEIKTVIIYVGKINSVFPFLKLDISYR
jgi:hypothetical protein